MRIRLEPRQKSSATTQYLILLLSFLLAFVIGGIILMLTGVDPLATYQAILIGAFGGTYNLSETLVKATPIMLCALGTGVSFKMSFWNIGAEGQIVVGGFAAAGVALFVPPLWPDIPPYVLLPLMFLAGFIAGALWGLIAGALQAYWGVNEILSTLMLNYIAILLVEYMYVGPWRDPHGWGFAGSQLFIDAARLPHWPGMRVHMGLLIGLVAAVILWVVMDRTRWGYRVRVIGENRQAARYSGMNVKRNILLVMIISGGLAGIGGMSEVSGVMFRLMQGLAAGYGFTAVVIVVVSRKLSLAIALVSFLLAALLVGGDQLQLTMRLPAAISLVLEGVILFTIIGGMVFTTYALRIDGLPNFLPRRVRPPSKAEVA